MLQYSGVDCAREGGGAGCAQGGGGEGREECGGVRGLRGVCAPPKDGCQGLGCRLLRVLVVQGALYGMRRMRRSISTGDDRCMAPIAQQCMFVPRLCSPL